MRAPRTLAAIAALLLACGLAGPRAILAHPVHNLPRGGFISAGTTSDYTRLSMVVSRTHLAVGETLAVSVTGRLGMPQYRLLISPSGMLTPLRPKPGPSGLIQYANSGGVTFIFRAARPGKVRLAATANGEIHDATCDCFKWATATSPTLNLVIVGPRKRSR